MNKEERQSKLKFILLALASDAVFRGETVGLPLDLAVKDIEEIYYPNDEKKCPNCGKEVIPTPTPNTKVIIQPMNQEGCLELNMCPCIICQTGYSEYGYDIQGQTSRTTCQDNCNFWQRWLKIIKGE